MRQEAVWEFPRQISSSCRILKGLRSFLCHLPSLLRMFPSHEEQGRGLSSRLSFAGFEVEAEAAVTAI